LFGVDHWGLSNGKLRIAFIDAGRDEIVKLLDIDAAGQPKGVTFMHNGEWRAMRTVALTEAKTHLSRLLD